MNHAPDTGRPWEHIPDTFGRVEDISDTLISREQSQFFLTDWAGNVPSGNNRGLGLYDHDTRYLSEYDFALDNDLPMVLLSRADSGFTHDQVLGNHRLVQEGRVIGRGTIEMDRQRVLGHTLEERLRITNYNTFPVHIRPIWRFAADFADIFEVRGHKREKPGQLMEPELSESCLTYRYLGCDGVLRSTRIQFDQAPTQLTSNSAAFDLLLAPRETRELTFSVVLDMNDRPEPDAGLHRLRQEYGQWYESFAHIHTDNEVFNQVLQRSLSDLRLLWTRDAQGQSYMAAGTPWFATLFGRDSIITALQTLPYRPDIARQCLALLARHQGQDINTFRAEEPGKILHEVRQGELAMIGELPYQRYYGSVDSTPLFLLLAGQYFAWTGDLELITGLLPAIKAGLRWLQDYGDPDGDGFIEYRTDSPDGLRNQGWKDSLEAIVHRDGRLCEGPIALAEVQGYVYSAYLSLAPLFQAMGDEHQAADLLLAAGRLRRAFSRSFWLPDHNRVAMALDGDKLPAEVMSSNAGQVLWSGILSHQRAVSVRDALFRNDMFSGWGIRTLSADCASYYPLGYHVGTVWPHDNGIIALGLKRYGFDEEVNELATSLFDAAREFPSYRLPELFGGQPRSEYQPPVPYPVACRPQAWTAGSMLHIMQAVLGLHPDPRERRLNVIRPHLPYWLRQVYLQGLPFQGGEVDLHFHREHGTTEVDYVVRGDVDVRVLHDWHAFEPEPDNGT